jgi:hypothetical protein
MADKLTDDTTRHWTEKPNTMIGLAKIDGETFRFMGKDDSIPAMEHISADCNAFSTTYVFEAKGVRLKAIFTSPLMPDDLYLLSRPISYLEIQSESLDRRTHDIKIKISVAEQICTDLTKSEPVECGTLSLGKLNSVKIGTVAQNIIPCAGDDLRINWGYFYLSTEGETSFTVGEGDELTYVHAEATLKKSTLFTFAYDDIYSIEYFHTRLKSYWNKDGALITDEIVKAHADYKATLRKCNAFADRLFIDAVRAGGEKYAEILELAFRQAIGAHKLVLDENGEVLFISKECFSNGCAATVDVSYPSVPLFLLYNPELVKGMMRPIYRYAQSKEWAEDHGYDFAPHDAGRYPIVNGQVYGFDKESGRLRFETF